MVDFIRNRKKVLVGGHRGCVCRHFENTIPAMEQALADGADYLEIDIQITRDGEIIVYHDTELSKKTSLKGYVHSYTWQELKAAVPQLNTLKEVLVWAKQRQAYLMLEIKSVPLDMQNHCMLLAKTLADLVREQKMHGQVLAFGADYMVLRHLKQLDPSFPIGLIVPFVPSDPVKLMKEMDAVLYLSYVYNMTEDIVARLHQAGYLVDGAILRDAKWTGRARDLGVDMYESDYPGRESDISPCYDV